MKNIDPVWGARYSELNVSTLSRPYWRVSEDKPTLSEDGDRQVTRLVDLHVAIIVLLFPLAVEVKTQRTSLLLDMNEPRRFSVVPPEFGPDVGTTS
jgi:hypothetical protein